VTDVILVLNAGSSSLKFSLFGTGAGEPGELGRGQIEGIGTAHPELRLQTADGATAVARTLGAAETTDHRGALRTFAAAAREAYAEARVIAVGNRVVHGGVRYSAPVKVDQEVLRVLDDLVVLAPLHQPHNLAAMRAVAAALPGVPQVACFDTAFHRGHPPVADHFALPREYYDRGVRRYGFHGLSYEYIASALPRVAPTIASGRVIVAHLGSGASLCALAAGRSVDSTMGFTALDGLPMGTRTGQIDPGVVLFLSDRGMSAREIESLFYRKSGLLGLSGVSNDMRDLLASRHPHAAQAVDLFVYQISKFLGALAAAMHGIDALVFTAGIGENAPEIRARVCADASWLGVRLDRDANARGGPCLSTADSPVSAWVIPTNEERMIAIHTRRVLSHRP
jgi:acetate kinase